MRPTTIMSLIAGFLIALRRRSACGVYLLVDRDRNYVLVLLGRPAARRSRSAFMMLNLAPPVLGAGRPARGEGSPAQRVSRHRRRGSRPDRLGDRPQGRPLRRRARRRSPTRISARRCTPTSTDADRPRRGSSSPSSPACSAPGHVDRRRARPPRLGRREHRVDARACSSRSCSGSAPASRAARSRRSAATSRRPRWARCSATSSQRVLGQYDLLVPDDAARRRRVLRRRRTSSALEKRFAFRPRDFRLWIAIHEVTHRAQFTGVPWMRDALPRRSCSRRSSRRSRPAHRVAARSRSALDEMRRGPQPARRRRPRRAVRDRPSNAACSARCRR